MATTVNLLVGTTKGAFAFTSDAERRMWECRGPLLPGWQIFDLLALPGTGRLVAATNHMAYGSTVRISDDHGATWRQQPESPRYRPGDGRSVQQIWRFSDPATDAADVPLYAGVAEAGLFTSSDAGESWTEVSGINDHPTRPFWEPTGPGSCLHTFVVDPKDPHRMWVGIGGAGVFRSDDAGRTWTVCSEGLPPAAAGHARPEVGQRTHKLAIDPRPPHTLYLQHRSGVFRSDDGADSWERIDTGLPSSFGFPITADHQGAVYVAPLSGPDERYMPDGRLALYRSDDRGESWQECRSGLPEIPHYVSVLRDAIATDTMDPAGVYFGTTTGELYASNDGGGHWQAIPGQFTRITSIRAHVTDS
jgi:photosystem II stability/assembly factor-like uncharacterized protein